jgi:hypothetical protein
MVWLDDIRAGNERSFENFFWRDLTVFDLWWANSQEAQLNVPELSLSLSLFSSHAPTLLSPACLWRRQRVGEQSVDFKCVQTSVECKACDLDHQTASVAKSNRLLTTVAHTSFFLCVPLTSPATGQPTRTTKFQDSFVTYKCDLHCLNRDNCVF